MTDSVIAAADQLAETIRQSIGPQPSMLNERGQTVYALCADCRGYYRSRADMTRCWACEIEHALAEYDAVRGARA